jgi:hypothetical protein
MLDLRAFLEAVVANGPRPPGSAGALGARRLLLEAVESIGLRPRAEPLNLDYSLPRYSVLTSRAGAHRVLPAMFSADERVSGDIRFVDTIDTARLDSVAGQILIWDGFLERREDYLAIARSGAAALVLSWADRVFSEYPWTDPVWKPWADEVRFPVASIGRKTACEVAPGPGAYEPRIESGVAESANVVWEVGSGALAVHALGHFDSLPEALGITDNACGVAVMLRASELLSAAPPEHVRVRFVATTGHESHHGAGAREYYRAHEVEVTTSAVMAVTCDCQGSKFGRSKWTTTAPALVPRLERIAQAHGLTVEVRDTLSPALSEAHPFAGVVPCVSFWRSPFAGHMFFDDLSIVDLDLLEHVAQAVADFTRAALPSDAHLPLTEVDRGGVAWYARNYGLPVPSALLMGDA